MKLVIVESPGKTKTISKYLGAGYRVEASVGHVRDLPVDLPRGETGIEPPDFRPKYEPTERGRSVLAKLRKLVAEADTVFLATDLDREGEAIAWHLKEALKLKNFSRVTFGEITPEAIRQGMQNPRSLNMPLVAAQEARRAIDRHVGYLVSPALSDGTGERLSAGRVQSIAVRLVVERCRAIKAFKATTHYGVKAHFDGWAATWKVSEYLGPDVEYLLDRATADEVAQLRTFTVAGFKDGQAHEAPPAPFITSTLQKAASNVLGLDPDVAMQVAQKLYESGAITYMRTDSRNLSDDALAGIYEAAQARGLQMADEPRRWPSKEGAQEAHEAIRPTRFDIEEAGETEHEKALYRLIWRAAFCSQLASAIYDARAVKLTTDYQGRELVFTASGRVLREKGWRAVLDGDPSADADEKVTVDNEPLPRLTVGQVLDAESAELLTKVTKAPAKYTQVSLINELERRGIGRPSTFAAIVKHVVQRGYIVETTGRRYDSTRLGELVVDSMTGALSFMEYDYTRELENDLDRIAMGEASFKDVVSRVFYGIKAELGGLKVAPATIHPCPDCGKPLRRRPGKGGHFWGCSAYPDCKTSLPDADGKPGVRAVVPVSEFKCPTCKEGNLIHRTKPAKGKAKGYDFWGCSRYPACDASFKTKEGKPDV